MTENIRFSQKNLSTLLLDRKPCAHAELFGAGGKSPLWGSVSLYSTPLGVLVKADFDGLGASTEAYALHLRFDGKSHVSAIPCSPGGSCRCLTAAFAVEDVLGSRVLLVSEGCDLPLALGKMHSVFF
ncbi:MAG: hypothetical protein J6D16_06880 [Clostridia bacterium]|nr:hypothetical protein [Clostridia bacterium]